MWVYFFSDELMSWFLLWILLLSLCVCDSSFFFFVSVFHSMFWSNSNTKGKEKRPLSYLLGLSIPVWTYISLFNQHSFQALPSSLLHIKWKPKMPLILCSESFVYCRKKVFLFIVQNYMTVDLGSTLHYRLKRLRFLACF